MKRILSILLVIGLAAFTYSSTIVIEEANNQRIEQVALSTNSKAIKIRLLALKHSKENIADIDANLAMSSVQIAKGKGLEIKGIGNHFINKDGRLQVLFLNSLISTNRIDLREGIEVQDQTKLQDFISQQMKIDAEAGDTVIVFTIGHGGPGGQLHNIGQRSVLMNAIAGAAEENNQRVLWWQLSCYASASLPAISSLPESQQKLISIIASSDATTQSGVGIQGKIMEKVFNALAEKDKSIDPNQDNVITAEELSNFLKNCNYRAAQDISSRVIAINVNYAIFGRRSLDIPVVDRNNPQSKYPDDYVPFP